MRKIAKLGVISDCSPGGSPDYLDGTADTVIVMVFNEDGRHGFGKTDTLPHVAKNFLEPNREGGGPSLFQNRLGILSNT
ncbi:MAG: hypothetical protein ACREEE_11350 [Dongiaceae bacterium]